MTAITQNFPWFIRDPAVSLIGEKCYRSLVENLQIGDIECIKYAVSKGLGLGIVVGGSIMKVPQVILILSARSARGLSLPAYVLETLAYAITLAYSYRNQFPFSTYGENLFLTLQNALITVLIVHYPSPTLLKARSSTTVPVAIASILIIAAGAVLFNLPLSTLKLLQLLTLPLSVFSKLPQIQANYTARSTGQLSTFAVVAQIAGCAARLFTTATEVGDRILMWGFLIALGLNVVLGVQMWLYWGRDLDMRKKEDLGSVPVSVGEKERAWARQSHVDIVVPPKSPTPQQLNASMQGGRKWARKVD